MFSFRRWREKYGRLTLRSLWDLFMVWVVIINLTLILFDLSYLWLRPIYFKHLPIITRIYDPVLGIRPHPLTDGLIDRAAETEELLALDPTAPALDDLLFDLERLTTRVFVEDPFLRSGQTENLAAIWTTMARETGKTVSSTTNPDIVAEVARDFWSGPPELLRHRFALFDQQIEPRLAINYFRGYDLNGKLIDHFWKIDLPFLILFWIEFVVRWTLAIRRRTYARWYFYPIFYWYDLLSLIPVTALRPLRLLRVISIYMRLRQSDLSRVGRDVLSRGVAYISNIITEEVSDRVAVRILDEYREEIVDGTHVRIARSTVEPRREEIERVLVGQIRAILTDDETIERFRHLLQLNLANAVEESESLRSLPLPHVVVKPVVSTVGEVLLDTTLETISTTLDSDEGQEALQALADSILEAVFYGPALGEIESLAKDISLQVIDHMKEVVAVKKWSLPDEQVKRPPMPWEAVDPD
jgi:hypothetical protein